MTRQKNPLPPWLLIASAASLGLTITFMMTLVLVATLLGKEVPTGTRFLVVIVLALGAGFGAGGLTGEAAVRGNLPIPGTERHPLATSLSGGIAVFFLVLLLRDFIVPSQNGVPELRIKSFKGLETNTQPPRVMISASFDGFSTDTGKRAHLALCADVSCQQVVRSERIDDPRNGRMVIFVATTKRTLQGGRLELEDLIANTTHYGKTARIEW